MRFILSTIFFTGFFGGVSLKYRKKIAELIRKVPLPKFVLSFAVLTLIAIVEENINCPRTGCFSFPEFLFPYTVKFFLILFAFELLVLKVFKIKNYWATLSVFGIIGWLVEFLIGGWKDMLWNLPWYLFAFSSIWTFATYAVMVIIPLTILEKKA